jgi:chitinase
MYGQWITGYYSAQNGVESIANIPWNNYTHVIHFAAAPGGNGTVSLNYLTQSEINQINSSKPAGKKVLVCIKDNGSNSNAFMDDTAPGMVNTFVSNIVNFVNQNGYDGVDIDWESNVNTTQYANFLTQLKSAMPNKLVTVATGNWNNLPDVAGAAAGSLDQVNAMCYDMDNTGSYTWYNDALLQDGDASKMTCDWRINALTAAGVPASKIGVGIPFYGRRHTGVTSPMQGGGSMFTVYYRDLVADPSRWQTPYMNYDTNYKADYLSVPALNEFISYNGTRSINDAVAWQKSRGFGGFMTFTMEYEYRGNQSGDARYPLSTALRNAVFGSSPGSSTPADPGPVLSGGSPSGTLAASATSATLTVNTNVDSYCAYSTTPNTPFSDMPYGFSTTGGTEHSTQVFGLSAGNTYTYYVKCSDAAQVASAKDYVISFSIATAATPVSGTTPSATVSPNTGNGMSATFAVKALDSKGANAIQQMNLMVGPFGKACYVQYWAPAKTVFLQNDAGTGWASAVIGSHTSLRNSQCTLDMKGTTVAASGTALTVQFPLSFQSSFAGGKSLLTFVADAASNSGWQQGGTWTVK